MAFVTQQTGRPSYCCYTREETITAGNSRHQMQMTVKMGAMNDGTITAIDLHTLSNADAHAVIGSAGADGNEAVLFQAHVDAGDIHVGDARSLHGERAAQGAHAVEKICAKAAQMWAATHQCLRRAPR